MKCPKCEVVVNEVTRAGVLVDVCPRCLGMWLDRGELEKIATRLREVERDHDDDYRYARSAEHGRGPDSYRKYDDDDDPRRYPKKKRWSDLFEIFD